MDIDDKIANIEAASRQFCGKIKKKGRVILEQYEITPPQLEALCLLDDGELTIGELSCKMFLACSTVTDLLDRMERNQLVKRTKDTKDRRIVRINIEPKGLEVINQVLEARRLYLKEMLSTCELDVIDDLNKYFTLLNEKMNL